MHIELSMYIHTELCIVINNYNTTDNEKIKQINTFLQKGKRTYMDAGEKHAPFFNSKVD